MFSSISSLARSYRIADSTVSQVASHCLTHIKKSNPTLQAWVNFHENDVLQQAAILDKEIQLNHFRSPLHGIPFGVKDVIDVLPYPTTAGSAHYRHTPSADADVISLLRQNGALILGKTLTTEFACSTDPVPTLNPLNPEHTPGGSSSGSAAAVASGLCFAAVGTQTAGSIIRPAAYCGVTGFKPTINSFSMKGIFPAAKSLDHVGFITRKVEDIGVIMDTLLSNSQSFTLANTTPIPIAYPKDWILEVSSKQTVETLEKLLELFASNSHKITPLTMPVTLQQLLDIHRCIMHYEVFQTHKEHFNSFSQWKIQYDSKSLKDIILSGEKISTQQYQEAVYLSRELHNKVLEVFHQQVKGIVLTPSVPDFAPKKEVSTGDPQLCVPWSLFGFPVICFPVGDPLKKKELTYSLQIIGKPTEDFNVLKAAVQLNLVLEQHNTEN